ncbi:RHS repeat-associated core domain-containing protein [Xanthomonas citri pv. citri]|uniref:RHS repeat-associated core domain-containing protein n=1 Tax=Xanthomonas citri TaxID=346 RepID=UPI0036DEFCCE
MEYIHTDALGSPVAVTNASGQVVERTFYEPYGAQVDGTPDDGPGFTGHVEDAATGLIYMQQRYYDPAIPRFLSVDPVTASSDPIRFFNRYKYASSNPYRFIDPDGRADVNYFYAGGFLGGGADPLYDSAQRFDIPGMTTVMGHSWATGYRDDRGGKPGVEVKYSSLRNDIANTRGSGGDQGYIFLGGCNVGLRYTPIRLAKDFNTSVISTVWYVRRSESSSGEITYAPNTKLDGTGSEGFFNLTRPDGTSSGKIASITMRADGKITFRGAGAPTGSHIKPKITIDPEDR